jgi:hypothetical protein
MDIASWLRQMGLEQYEPVFRAHAIDGSVRPFDRFGSSCRLQGRPSRERTEGSMRRGQRVHRYIRTGNSGRIGTSSIRVPLC